jgi:AAA domain
MSPVTVAQYLPPGSVDFDLLVIDEASQVRPEDALGLIARCRRIVVVGDKKQLPPTNFFDRMIADEIDPRDGEETAIRHPDGAAPITDLESILSLCEARGLESQMLRWHYRSRHPSLIEVSNAEFYHRLVMPPAPVTERAAKGSSSAASKVPMTVAANAPMKSRRKPSPMLSRRRPLAWHRHLLDCAARSHQRYS